MWMAWVYSGCLDLTHWGRVTHICVGNLTIIGSDNGLSPGRRQAITWTNVGILLIGHLGTNFSEMLIEIHTFSFKKIHLKMSSGKWWPFCLGLNALIHWPLGWFTASWILVNIGSGKGSVLDGTKPLPEPVLTYRRLNSKTDISMIVQYISNISIEINLTECIFSSISSKMLAILFKSCDVKSKYTSFIRWSDCQSTDSQCGNRVGCVASNYLRCGSI